MILQNWWYTSLLSQKYPPLKSLEKDMHADVLIVGGGMTGLSAAMTFLGKGLKVVLIERNVLGGSSTGRSAGFLTPDSELELHELERRFGVEGAKLLWSVPVRGAKLIVDRVHEYGITCDLQKQDSLFVGIGKGGAKAILEEKKSREKVGMDSVLYNESELHRVLGTKAFTGAIRYGDTYGISGLQYAQGIKKVLVDGGIEVFEATEARKIKGHTVTTHKAKITADQIVIAIDKMEPSFSRFSREVFHAQTFLCISEPLNQSEFDALFPSGEEFQCWDSSLVYSYWRLTGDRRLLLGGGSAMTTFMNHWYNNKKIIEGVIQNFIKKFPKLKNLHFVQWWPGLIDTTRDLLPTIVRDAQAPHVHYAFGIVGLPWASFCGDFLARVILDKAEADEMKFFSYFSDRRYFFLPASLQKIVGKPIVFSINNGWAKYYQVDTDRRLKFLRDDF